MGTLCTYPGCMARIERGPRCPAHRYSAELDRRRPSPTARGYDGAWRRYRRQFLRANPLCVACSHEGRITPATVVDHIQPHRGDPVRFADPANHQALCASHHGAKSHGERLDIRQDDAGELPPRRMRPVDLSWLGVGGQAGGVPS